MERVTIKQFLLENPRITTKLYDFFGEMKKQYQFVDEISHRYMMRYPKMGQHSFDLLQKICSERYKINLQ